NEALDVSRQAPPGLLLSFADLLRQHGHAEPAERLVRERTTVGQDYQATEWLKTRAIERGDLAEAQALSEAQFWRNPTLAGYDEVKKHAQERGRWDGLRQELLARLAKEGKYGPLTEIHLQEGEVDQALK